MFAWNMPTQRKIKGYDTKLNRHEEAEAKKRSTRKGVARKVKKYDGRALNSARPKRDKIMRVFYEEVDLPEFKEALQFSKDPRFRMLFEAISSPKLHKCSFAELCRRCGLGIHDISNIYRDHQKHRGLMRAYNHMPQILEDTAVDAQTRVVTCDLCNGVGKVFGEDAVNQQESSICPKCHGDGKVRIVGDKDSRKLMFETAGLSKGGAQTAVQVNVGGAVPSLEDMVAEVEDAIDITSNNGDDPMNVEESDVWKEGGEAGSGETDGLKQIGEGSPEIEDTSGEDPESGGTIQ